jgi:hypothetical protein
MLKLIATLVLSAAIFMSAPNTHVKNLEHKAAVAKPAGQVHQTVTAPAQVAKQVETPAPQPAPAQPAQGCEAYRNEFAKYSWNVDMAIAICKAESNGNTNAISSTADRGLMQINYIHADMVGGNLNALYDPVTNIRVAASIYGGRGWNAWSTYLNGAYLANCNNQLNCWLFGRLRTLVGQLAS